jgi:hypothetical protein
MDFPIVVLLKIEEKINIIQQNRVVPTVLFFVIFKLGFLASAVHVTYAKIRYSKQANPFVIERGKSNWTFTVFH